MLPAARAGAHNSRSARESREQSGAHLGPWRSNWRVVTELSDGRGERRNFSLARAAALREMALERRTLVAGQYTEHVEGDDLEHVVGCREMDHDLAPVWKGRSPSRNASRAVLMRVLIVPSGWPSTAAISLWDMPV